VLSECKDARVDELWKTTSRVRNHEINVIAVKSDGTYTCSCRLLENRGIVCAHFFALLDFSSITKFHVALVNPRWYRDGVTLADVAKEPAVNIHGNIEDAHAVSLLVSSLNNIRGEYIGQQTAEKRNEVKRFATMWGKCREATQLSCELKDERLSQFLETIIQDLHRKKLEKSAEKGYDTELSSGISSDEQVHEKENIDPDTNSLHNPGHILTKGRPRKRRIPNEGEYNMQTTKKRTCQAANEPSNDRRRPCCKSCGQEGHYTPTCPSNKKVSMSSIV
jgi:hypothetical protein